MLIVLGIEKTHVTDGEDRFAMQLVEDRDSAAGKVYCTATIEDLTEDLVRRLGAARLLTPGDLDGFLDLARLSYDFRVPRP